MTGTNERAGGAAAGRGNISRWSIEHPYAVIAFYLGVALLAVLVIGFQMPRRMMPYVESPLAGIVSMMPGLSAEEMETYFSKPIEERMVDLKNVHFVRSTSQEGFSIVTVEFWYGTDMKKALFDVQSLMNVVQADLPMTGANIKPSWVLAIDPLNIPVLSLAVTGEGYDPVQLRTLVENEVVNRLKVVKDVYSVVPFGGQKLQMQVIVDRERLAAYRMSLPDLKRMLDMQNQSRPAGTLTFQDREVLVRTDARARAPEEVAAYPIASMEGRTVYLRDVADVVTAAREQRSLYRFNGKEAVALIGAAYVGGQTWLERPAPPSPGRAAAGWPTPPPRPPMARDLLGRADALGLTAGQRARLAALDRAWGEESGEVERAVEVARTGFERFAREAGIRGPRIEEVQRQSAEYRELSAALREARQRHTDATRAVLSEAQRQSLAGDPSASGDGGMR